jgi:intein-encoded DNA endonuclease-like protein
MRRKQTRVINWSPKLAYVVGLITTDGNLSIDKRHINFTSTDKQLLKTVLLCLKKSNRITLNPPGDISKKVCYKIQIGDVVFYDFLVKTGIFPHKSLNIGELSIPDKYFIDFLRGHLDGDGSIVYYKDRYNTYLNSKYIYDRLFVYFISASKNHIEWLQQKIILLIKVFGNIENIKSKTITRHPIYRLKFSTKEARMLLKWIYYEPSLPCLLRKYRIAKPFIN